MNRDETATDTEPGAESRPSAADSALHATRSGTSIEPGGATQANTVQGAQSGARPGFSMLMMPTCRPARKDSRSSFVILVDDAMLDLL